MNLSIQEILTQAGAFILLVFVLKKFAWKPLLTLLDARRDKIAHDIEAVERTKKEIEGIKAQYDASRSKLEEEARVKLQEAITEGKRISKEMQETARNESRALLDKAKEDLGIEVAKAKVSLRDEIANLTLNATEQILDEKLDSAKDKSLVLKFMDQLGSKK